MENKLVGSFLQALRTRRKETQAEFVHFLNNAETGVEVSNPFSQARMSKLEAGKASLKALEYLHIMNACEVEFDEFNFFRKNGSLIHNPNNERNERIVLGSFIKDLRTRQSMTQSGLAKRLSETDLPITFSASWVSKTEQGTQKVEVLVLRRILLICGSSWDEFEKFMKAS